MNTNIKIIKKINNWVLSFLFLSFAGLYPLAAEPSQNLKLLYDLGYNGFFFEIAPVSGVMQILESIKPYGNSAWGAPFTISDPSINVNCFEVEKDVEGNMVVVWMGENTEFSVYSLYVRIFLSVENAWSPITQVSENTQNLTGKYITSINTKNVEIIWTTYDENFSIENHALTISIEP